MADIAIRVENIGKRYQIGGTAVKYRTLRETMSESFKKPFQHTGQERP